MRTLAPPFVPGRTPPTPPPSPAPPSPLAPFQWRGGHGLPLPSDAHPPSLRAFVAVAPAFLRELAASVQPEPGLWSSGGGWPAPRVAGPPFARAELERLSAHLDTVFVIVAEQGQLLLFTDSGYARSAALVFNIGLFTHTRAGGFEPAFVLCGLNPTPESPSQRWSARAVCSALSLASPAFWAEQTFLDDLPPSLGISRTRLIHGAMQHGGMTQPLPPPLLPLAPQRPEGMGAPSRLYVEAGTRLMLDDHASRVELLLRGALPALGAHLPPRASGEFPIYHALLCTLRACHAAPALVVSVWVRAGPQRSLRERLLLPLAIVMKGGGKAAWASSTPSAGVGGACGLLDGTAVNAVLSVELRCDPSSGEGVLVPVAVMDAGAAALEARCWGPSPVAWLRTAAAAAIMSPADIAAAAAVVAVAAATAGGRLATASFPIAALLHHHRPALGLTVATSRPRSESDFGLWGVGRIATSAAPLPAAAASVAPPTMRYTPSSPSPATGGAAATGAADMSPPQRRLSAANGCDGNSAFAAQPPMDSVFGPLVVDTLSPTAETRMLPAHILDRESDTNARTRAAAAAAAACAASSPKLLQQSPPSSSSPLLFLMQPPASVVAAAQSSSSFHAATAMTPPPSELLYAMGRGGGGTAGALSPALDQQPHERLFFPSPAFSEGGGSPVSEVESTLLTPLRLMPLLCGGEGSALSTSSDSPSPFAGLRSGKPTPDPTPFAGAASAGSTSSDACGFEWGPCAPQAGGQHLHLFLDPDRSSSRSRSSGGVCGGSSGSGGLTSDYPLTSQTQPLLQPQPQRLSPRLPLSRGTSPRNRNDAGEEDDEGSSWLVATATTSRARPLGALPGSESAAAAAAASAALLRFGADCMRVGDDSHAAFGAFELPHGGEGPAPPLPVPAATPGSAAASLAGRRHVGVVLSILVRSDARKPDAKPHGYVGVERALEPALFDAIARDAPAQVRAFGGATYATLLFQGVEVLRVTGRDNAPTPPPLTAATDACPDAAAAATAAASLGGVLLSVEEARTALPSLKGSAVIFSASWSRYSRWEATALTRVLPA